MRKFLIPLAAIAATVAAVAPASASPDWASNGYGYRAPVQPMYGYGYGAPVQPMYGYGYNRGRSIERFEHRMDRRMMMRSGRGFGWNGRGGHERRRW